MRAVEAGGMLRLAANRDARGARPVDHMTRGFHRLGLAFAAPLAVVAVWCLVGSYVESDPNSAAGFIGLCAGLAAAVWYGLCRAVAWVVNGFRQTSPVMTDHD